MPMKQNIFLKMVFKNIWICDWAAEPLSMFSKRVPTFPTTQLLNTDYFKISDKFDLVLEQTFFCALPPTLRGAYAIKTAALLQDRGRLVGLLFAKPFPFNGPPFGGTKEEYLQLFSPQFVIEKLEISYNSIPPRQDQELFINFLKKS